MSFEIIPIHASYSANVAYGGVARPFKADEIVALPVKCVSGKDAGMVAEMTGVQDANHYWEPVPFLSMEGGLFRPFSSRVENPYPDRTWTPNRCREQHL